MTPATTDAARPNLEVRGARASSVVVQRIPPDAADVFMAWQHGISAAAAQFPGYQTTEIYPPPGPEQDWVVVVHFDDAKSLQGWLEAPMRAEWIAKLPREIREFHIKTLPTGFGSWFAGLPEDRGPLPHWKMFVTVLLGLYPTVMLLTFFLSPHTERFGMAIAMLIGNAASVAFLEWFGMPVLNRFLGPWLGANGMQARVFSLMGLALILGALGVMTFVFHLINRQAQE
jgi:antibiotic biosynthesis monooxygenase (ABM) superfamily enzyme